MEGSDSDYNSSILTQEDMAAHFIKKFEYTYILY